MTNFLRKIVILFCLSSLAMTSRGQQVIANVDLVGGVFPAQNLSSNGNLEFGIVFNSINIPNGTLEAGEIHINIMMPSQIQLGTNITAITYDPSYTEIPTSVWTYVKYPTGAASLTLNSSISYGSPDGIFMFSIPYVVLGPIEPPTNGANKNWLIDLDVSSGDRILENISGAITQKYSIITATPTSLPVTFNQFTATAKSCETLLEWNVGKELGTERYAIERSADGKGFENIGGFAFNGNAKGKYRFMDESPLEGSNLYRIAAIDPDGSVVYSDVKRVTLKCEVSNIAMFPNPTSTGVKINGLKAGQNIQLYDLSGRLLINTKATSNEVQLDLSNYAVAMYKVVVTSAEGNVIYNARLAKQ